MAENTAEKFIEALRRLERDRDVETIAGLFTDGAEIHNVMTIDNAHQLAPSEFWTNYRETFGEVNSEFKNKIVSETRAALEWTTTGTNRDGGGEFAYEGVSVLEFEGGKIKRFFAYFNPEKLGTQIVGEAARA